MVGIRQWGQRFIDRLFGREPCEDKSTPAQIRALAREAVEETGAGDYLRRLMAAKDDGERERLRSDWEAKMAARKAALDNPGRTI